LKAGLAVKALLDAFGGYDAWAQEVALDLEAAERGSNARIALHRMFLTAMLQFSEGGVGDDADTEEQVQLLLDQQIKELQSLHE